MNGPNPISTTELPLPLFRRGKVRDVYEAGPESLLLVASDRVSAFDCVLPQPIPRKGEVLTLLSAWWLEELGRRHDDDAVRPHHLITVDPAEILARVPELEGAPEDAWARRSMLVRRTEPVPVECVVRGFLAGSAWREYERDGTLAGERLPGGLAESARLERPLFSPATKADAGHDENITFDVAAERIGADLAATLRDRSLRLYAAGAEIAETRGVILADTKFEFGRLPDGTVLLIDEVMTPDSSRYWPKEHYAPGRGQPSLDKQPIRDWLDALEGWDKRPPPPDLSPKVVRKSSARYLEIFRRLTRRSLDDYEPRSFSGEDGLP